MSRWILRHLIAAVISAIMETQGTGSQAAGEFALGQGRFHLVIRAPRLRAMFLAVCLLSLSCSDSPHLKTKVAPDLNPWPHSCIFGSAST